MVGVLFIYYSSDGTHVPTRMGWDGRGGGGRGAEEDPAARLPYVLACSSSADAEQDEAGLSLSRSEEIHPPGVIGTDSVHI